MQLPFPKAHSQFVLCILIAFYCFSTQAVEITYTDKIPIIDGKRDHFLNHLTKQEFAHFYDFENKGTKKVNITYSLAYTTEGLYILFETDADKLSYHKRGFLYGDGFKVIIGDHKASERSKEYYEIVYSPTLLKEDMKYRQYIASYNFTGGARRLSEKSNFQAAQLGDGTSFEALISWQDIYPYHPKFTPNIGINLYFAKGLIDKNNNYVTNGFSIKHDEGIWDEEIPFRALSKARFISSYSSSDSSEFQIKERTLSNGSLLTVETVLNNHSDWEITNEEMQLVSQGKFQSKSNPTLTSRTIDVSKLTPGQYYFNLQNGKKHSSFIILPELKFDTYLGKLTDFSSIPLGAKNTFKYKIQSFYQFFDELKPYEDGSQALELIDSINSDWKKIEQKVDPYINIKVPYLRAFHSELDGTLQGYSIKLPENYNPDRKYPLLVFLHGSNQDHKNLLSFPRGNGVYIEIAPFGRDKFKAYAYKQSQIDIEEAINDAINHFSVDTDNIVIGGFSMGGYGALLTYYRNPELFKAIAVFAGHPNLANQWISDIKSPNFQQQKFLKPFKGVPIFIYHGTKDPALSFELAKQLAKDLKRVGAKVTSSFIPDRGHVYQDEATQNLYNNWLNSLY